MLDGTWRFLRYPLLFALLIYGIEEIARGRREYGECCRRVESARKVSIQPECQTHDGLTRMDNEFIKCQTAVDTVDEAELICAIRRWAWNGWWVKVVTAANSMSYSVIVAAMGTMFVLAWMMIQGVVADRHNQRGVEFLRNAFPSQPYRQTIQTPPMYPQNTIGYHRRAPSATIVPYWGEEDAE